MLGRLKLPIWILPLAIAGLVAALGWWGNNRLRETIEEELKAQLTATLNANVAALQIWTTNQTRMAAALAEDPAVSPLARQILQTPRPQRRELRPPAEVESFAFELRPRLSRLGYEVAQLVSTNFQVVANSQRLLMGGNVLVAEAHTNKFAELFASGKPVMITPFKPEFLEQRPPPRDGFGPTRTNEQRRFNRPPFNTFGRNRRGDITLMQIAAPVRDAQSRVIGALALIINPENDFSRILSVAHSGESGETYAFDQTGLMISRSQFDLELKQLGLLDVTNTSSALNFRLHDPGGDLTKGFKPAEKDRSALPLTQLVASAVEGEDTVDVTPARDYRGVLVVGASRWLPQYGFGVATQLDADEAFRPLHVLQWIFVALILFLLLCATAMFVISNVTLQRRLSEAELKLRQLGQYTLEEKIGEGGMGVVYRARHALLRRDTAVKLLMPELASEAAISRFEREVRLTCQLTHPNTIQVYDYGHTPDGIFYYAMEYLRGVNLHDLVARYGPQPESRVVYLLAQICDSLSEAHALGLIHRDIKPGNIFLCRRGGVPDFVKVLDFGLVREFMASDIEDRSSGGEQLIEGTPWFTPPEAIQGSAPSDPRSDLYSLAALGYFLLTGNYIFDADTVEEIHQKQLSCAPIPPSQRTTQPISREIEQLLLRCLEKDMNLRPQSALEFKWLLLATPAAQEWTPEARNAWWNGYDQQPAASEPQPTPSATPLPTVSIDLSSRAE